MQKTAYERLVAAYLDELEKIAIAPLVAGAAKMIGGAIATDAAMGGIGKLTKKLGPKPGAVSRMPTPKPVM